MKERVNSHAITPALGVAKGIAKANAITPVKDRAKAAVEVHVPPKLDNNI